MIHRRKRVALLYHEPGTLSELKQWADRDIELLAAGDLPTVEAALNLYRHIDAVIAEQVLAGPAALQTMRIAQVRHPSAPRILLVTGSAMAQVFAAVRERLVTELIFLPFASSQLSQACGFPARNVAPASTPMRLRQPPLTGGSSASSSPSFRR